MRSDALVPFQYLPLVASRDTKSIAIAAVGAIWSERSARPLRSRGLPGLGFVTEAP